MLTFHISSRRFGAVGSRIFRNTPAIVHKYTDEAVDVEMMKWVHRPLKAKLSVTWKAKKNGGKRLDVSLYDLEQLDLDYRTE